MRWMGTVRVNWFLLFYMISVFIDGRYLPRDDEDEQTTTRVEGIASVATENHVRQALAACAEARAAGMTVCFSCIILRVSFVRTLF